MLVYLLRDFYEIFRNCSQLYARSHIKMLGVLSKGYQSYGGLNLRGSDPKCARFGGAQTLPTAGAKNVELF